MAEVDHAHKHHPGPLQQQSSTDEQSRILNWLRNTDSDTTDEATEIRKSDEEMPLHHETNHVNTDHNDSKRLQDKKMQHPRSAVSQKSSTSGTLPPASAPKPEDSDENGGGDGLEQKSAVSATATDSVDEDEDEADENEGQGLNFENLSESQRQAEMEYQNMKLDLGYTVDEEPPEYDVTERVRQLNEELAKEPSPSESDRERAIKFPENPVSLVVPPVDYPESEEDETNTNNNRKANVQNNTQSESVSSSYTGGSKPKSVSMEVLGAEETQERDTEEVVPSPRDSSEHSDGEDAAVEQSPREDHQNTKTEIGDEVEDYDEDNFHNDSQQETDHSVGDNSDSNTENSERVASKKSRPKSSGPSRARQRERSPLSDGDSNSDNQNNTTQNNMNSSSNEEEKILVERNGEFELLKPSDLSAEERQIYGVKTKEDIEEESKSHGDSVVEEEDKAESVHSSASDSSGAKPKHQPHPPAEPKPRPYTAATNGNNRRHARSSNKLRSQSATKQRSTTQVEGDTDYNFDYTSPYALPAEERKKLRKEHNQKMKQQKDEEQRKKDREERDKDEANEAFKAWLIKKRQDASKRREEDNDRKKREQEDQDTGKRDPESAYKDWCSVKKQQQKRKKKEHEAEQREYESVHLSRSRNECNKAFKEWLKKKNTDLRRQHVEEKQKNRVFRLMSRKSRKSQQLAKAMAHAQTFKYVDYYGYRF